MVSATIYRPVKARDAVRRLSCLRLAGLATSALVALLVPGCGSEETAAPAPPPSPEPARPASISVTPATASLTSLGDTVRLVAEVRDQRGRPVEGTAVAWASGDRAVASVDGSGLVTAAGNGTASVTATSATVSARASLTVMQEASRVTVTPAADTLVAGGTLRLSSDAFDANGHAVAGAVFAWSTSDVSVATVDSTGLVHGVAAGTAAIVAAAGSAKSTADIVVEENSDRTVLTALYEATDGPNWVNNDNWLTDSPLGEWYGVETDRDGRVVKLVVPHNNLSGRIPRNLGRLARLSVLHLDYNVDLSGPIPPEVGSLDSLTSLRLNHNDLSGPIPPELGALARLQQLSLASNDLTGPIPPELGGLVNLIHLGLWENRLTGPIPSELGNLESLTTLTLQGNVLTGRIPPALGHLADLLTLYLGYNRLSGPIPPELGTLAQLRWLHLGHNDLTGSIPPDLGGLGSLQNLFLYKNHLSGPVPPELGRSSNLERLELSDNDAMTGALPVSLTTLQLKTLLAGGTGLCAPSDARFRAWLAGILKRRVANCAGAAAYMTQAVQSRGFPVPLVAGEKALLRVFPTAPAGSRVDVPPVRARFYLDGQETHMVDIPGKSGPIPAEVDEGDLSRSANLEVPDWVVWPGLEMVIEVDPEGTLDPALGVSVRIPETGRLAVEVGAVPPLDLTVVPFLWRTEPDSAVLTIAARMASNPDGHDLLEDTRTLLPVAELAVTAHEPVLTSTNNAFSLLRETEAIRTIEGGTGHYMGMMTPRATGAAGVASTPGWSSFAMADASVIAHELGHNLSLSHAPCSVTGYTDPGFPTADGTIGAWGYDARARRLVNPETPDLMSYCGPQWISDYHFSNALRYRLTTIETASTEFAPGRSKSLLVWGGVDADGAPFLEPAFVLDAPPALPRTGGDYRLAGRVGGGEEMFSFNFTMPEIADADGRSSFAFVLPLRPEWEGRLAGLVLTGPDGSAVLDGESDRPMAILRDPRTGRIRGIVRGPPGTATLAEALATLSPEPTMEVLYSRGLPGAEAWMPAEGK